VSGLARGATLVLFDGSPFVPEPGVLWKIAEEERITVFGTSAKYLAALEKSGERPARDKDLSALRAVLSTGSPLAPESFDYVYRDIKDDLQLSSISGGTDIISCFALGCPALPVYRGELQCRGLGMAVEIRDEDGNAVTGEKGELVCTRPFPSMPTGFWDDPDGEVVESIAIGQRWGDDVRVVLFVRLRDRVALDEDLAQRIRATIRQNTTPRHVPAKIVPVADIPRTISGKIVELAVRNVVHGEPVRNTDALANPEALQYFRDRPELQED
jgi:acetoacetyl-CoA synthetase